MTWLHFIDHVFVITRRCFFFAMSLRRYTVTLLLLLLASDSVTVIALCFRCDSVAYMSMSRKTQFLYIFRTYYRAL